MIKKRVDALIDQEYIERIIIEGRPAYKYIV
jgi:hypothetical protein